MWFDMKEAEHFVNLNEVTYSPLNICFKPHNNDIREFDNFMDNVTEVIQNVMKVVE